MRFIFIGERIMRAYESCNMLAAVQQRPRHAILMQCARARSLIIAPAVRAERLLLA